MNSMKKVIAAANLVFGIGCIGYTAYASYRDYKRHQANLAEMKAAVEALKERNPVEEAMVACAAAQAAAEKATVKAAEAIAIDEAIAKEAAEVEQRLSEVKVEVDETSIHITPAANS